MAHTDVKNTFVGVPKVTGGIWRVPQNIALPTTAYAPRPAGSLRLGGVSDDGYKYSTERSVEKKKDWNGDKVRSIQTSKDDSFDLTFIEFLNPNVMSLLFNDENVTVTAPTLVNGTHIATKSVADALAHGAYIIDTFDGKVKRRRCIPDAQPDKIDPVSEKPGDWSVWAVTFDVFPDSQGVTSYTYTELGDRIVPSTWNVAITGSAGTYTITVDGSTTTALPYSSTTATVKTALELLPTVGTGNSTVTGSAASYVVALANGGVLTGTGTGGATVAIT